MSQHDYVLSNAAGATIRADLNQALAAIVSQNSGASEPSDTFPYMFWADLTNSLLKMRNADDDAWITLFSLNQSTNKAIASGGVESGTAMVFYQAAAPTGWTKKTNWTANASLVVGNTFGSGGSDSAVSFTTGISVDTHDNHNHSITVATHGNSLAENGPHSHNISYSIGEGTGTTRSEMTSDSHAGYFSTVSSGSGTAHGHSGSSSGTVSATGARTHSVNQSTYSPVYVIMIVATKD